MISDAKRGIILIVEDELLIRMNAVEMIEEAGFEVVEAASADEAIANSRTPVGHHCRIHRYPDAGQHGWYQACCRGPGPMATDQDRGHFRPRQTWCRGFATGRAFFAEALQPC